MIRPAAVAGQFYPGSAPLVAQRVEALWPAPAPVPRRARGVVVPHAGWRYSGRTAALVYASVEVPDRVVLIGPNHHGLGARYAVFAAGAWEGPGGEVAIDEPLARALLEQCDLLTSDPRAHQREHCLEVQVPLLQHANPRVRLVPLLIGGPWPEAGGRQDLRAIGAGIARAVGQLGEPVLLVASTDLNHYADQATSNRKDHLVLEAVVALDEDALMDRVAAEDVSMCGVAPTYIVMVAAKQLGARRAELLDYRTSGDVSGDYAAVVGYGGVVLER